MLNACGGWLTCNVRLHNLPMTTIPNWIESRKRSVDNLQRIYTFVVSLSVVEALRRVLTDLPKIPELDVWLRLGVVLVTVIPFYHGANRYLDAAYVTGERSSVRYALLVDFLFLFVEGILFFVLSLVIREASWFYIVFVILLAIDILWVLSTGFTSRVERGAVDIPGIGRWALINVFCVLIVLLIHWTAMLPVQFWKYSFAQPALFCVAAILRSFFDYYFQWTFYYPETTSSQAAEPDAPPNSRRAAQLQASPKSQSSDSQRASSSGDRG
jgi:hypothetical protein